MSGDDFKDMGLSVHCRGQSGTKEDADNVVDAGQIQATTASIANICV